MLGVVGAFTSGGLAAWGVPFLELARMGRTDVWVSTAPSFKSCPHPRQHRVGRLLQALAQHKDSARLACRSALPRRQQARNSPQPSCLCMESPLFAWQSPDHPLRPSVRVPSPVRHSSFPATSRSRPVLSRGGSARWCLKHLPHYPVIYSLLEHEDRDWV